MALGCKRFNAPDTGVSTAVQHQCQPFVSELVGLGAHVRFGAEVVAIGGDGLIRTTSGPVSARERDRLRRTVGRPAGRGSGAPRDPGRSCRSGGVPEVCGARCGPD